MKLAISNIAWDTSENVNIIPLLKQYGVTGIEIAPTKRWEEPVHAEDIEIINYKNYWASHALVPVSMQSLLFNKNYMSIFGHSKLETLHYIKQIIILAGKLGIKAVVFGSPKNRLMGESDQDVKYGEAVDFFRILGDQSVKSGVHLCMEPNPKDYGCDFITNSLEGLQFVKDVGHMGIKLQLDTSTILINEEESEKVIPLCLPYTGHFHVSDPFLNIPGTHNNGHEKIASILNECNYNGWLSIEMKNGILSDNRAAVLEALKYVTRIYTGLIK